MFSIGQAKYERADADAQISGEVQNAHNFCSAGGGRLCKFYVKNTISTWNFVQKWELVKRMELAPQTG
jgi:hypothetical protein